MHCATCYQLGVHTARHYAVIRWHGSDIEWTHTFPCSLSRNEFLEEVGTDAEIIERGVCDEGKLPNELR
jgi:hypothetical protein